MARKDGSTSKETPPAPGSTLAPNLRPSAKLGQSEIAFDIVSLIRFVSSPMLWAGEARRTKWTDLLVLIFVYLSRF